MSSELLFTLLVLAVAAERMVEVAVSKRNAAWALAHGGVETGRGHYPVMVALHTAFLVGMLVEVWVRRPDPALALTVVMLVLVVLCQGVRHWCVATLGRRWNTRVIVVPGEPLVRSGPYRYLAHPNYVIVVVEGVALPLVHGAWITAVVFTLANAALLTVRIRVEERALRSVSAAA